MRVQSRSRTIFGVVVFLLPVLALYGAYFVYPLAYVFGTSLFETNGVTSNFVGLANFAEDFADATFRVSVRNNFIWVVSLGFGQVGLALLVAMMLAHRPRGWRFLRTVYFLPNVISQVALAMMWAALYNAEYGAINQFLELIGLQEATRNWLGSLQTALPAVLMQQVFYIGYFMIILLAATMSIPTSLYEAAQIDGAGVLQQDWHITIPMIRDILVTAMTLAMAYGLRHFESTFLLTGGGPANITSVLGIQLYRRLGFLDYGGANTIGVVLIVLGVLLIVTIRVLGRRTSAAEQVQ